MTTPSEPPGQFGFELSRPSRWQLWWLILNTPLYRLRVSWRPNRPRVITGTMPRTTQGVRPPNQDTHCWHPIDGPSARVTLSDPPSGGTDAVRCCWCPSRAEQHWQRVTIQREGHGLNARVSARRITATVFTEYPVACPHAAERAQNDLAAAARAHIAATRRAHTTRIVRRVAMAIGWLGVANMIGSVIWVLHTDVVGGAAGRMTMGEWLGRFYPQLLPFIGWYFAGWFLTNVGKGMLSSRAAGNPQSVHTPEHS